ncbi:hypothetical protein RGL42_004638 [Vibrio parahaemolyticus]|nr:hypothetical protein [Vibrio parahaemolyticus]ELA8113041.1 hypothetical protein [Vibrio parahaemolyticus]ELA8166766.1 hypothetical protein [Vibrio parahaemolyticus]
MENPKLYFMNENYQKLTDLLIAKHDFSNAFIGYTELSVINPLQYETMNVGSKFRKSFYDSDALYIDEDIFNKISLLNIKNVYSTPVSVKFTDGVSFNYIRLDSKLEIDVVDKENSIYDEDGDLIKLSFDLEKIQRIKAQDLDFFKVSGLEAYQYVVSERVKNELVKHTNDIEFKDEKEFEVLW